MDRFEVTGNCYRCSGKGTICLGRFLYETCPICNGTGFRRRLNDYNPSRISPYYYQ